MEPNQVTTKSGSSMMIAAVVGVVVIVVAIAAGAFVFLGKDEVGDSPEDTANFLEDVAKEQEKIETYKMTIEEEKTGKKSTFIIDNKTGDSAWIMNEGKDDEYKLFDVDGVTYMYSGGAWQKFTNSTDGSSTSDEPTGISDSDLEMLKTYMNKVDDEDCLGSDGKCYVYVAKEDSASDWGKVRINKKTKLFDSGESNGSKFIFEYKDVKIELPEEAKNAKSFDELLDDSIDSIENDSSVEDFLNSIDDQY